MKRSFYLLSLSIVFFSGCDLKEVDKENSSSSEITYHCEALNGKREGLCVGSYPSKRIHDSTYYHNDLKDGKCIVFYPNEKVKYLTSYKRGLLNGNYLEYHDNGNLSRMSFYKNNEEIGLIREYDYLGKLKLTSEWLLINGHVEMNYIKRFYPDGSLKLDSTFFADIHLNKDTFKLGDDIIISAKLYGSWRDKYKKYYSMKLATGKLDDDFSIVDSISIKDAYTFQDDTLSLIVKTGKKGVNILRGFVTADSSLTEGTLYPCFSKKIYFERKYFVK